MEQSMKRATVLLGLLALLLVSAYAQSPVNQIPLINAKLPFEFVLSGKTLPAGNYVFSLTDSESQLTVKNQASGAVVKALVMTQLANSPDSKVVGVTFDVRDGKNFLEAVWPVAGRDGYLIHVVKEKHTHKVVTPQKPRPWKENLPWQSNAPKKFGGVFTASSWVWTRAVIFTIAACKAWMRGPVLE
jgi:hypothetical protein